MEKAEISWFLTIWLFFTPFGFFGRGLALFLKRCLATLTNDGAVVFFAMIFQFTKNENGFIRN